MIPSGSMFFVDVGSIVEIPLLCFIAFAMVTMVATWYYDLVKLALPTLVHVHP